MIAPFLYSKKCFGSASEQPIVAILHAACRCHVHIWKKRLKYEGVNTQRYSTVVYQDPRYAVDCVSFDFT